MRSFGLIFTLTVLLISLSGCSRTKIYDARFDSVVSYLERKYQINFSITSHTTRYLDISDDLKNELISDGENPALAILVAPVLLGDPGTKIMVNDFQKNSLLSFDLAFDDGTRLVLVVQQVSAAQTRLTFKSNRLFSRFVGEYRKSIDREIVTGRIEFYYHPTKVRNMTTFTKQLIKNRKHLSFN